MTKRAYLNFHAPVNTVTAQNLLATCTQLCAQGHDELYLLLSTPGGSVTSGVTIYNVLRGLAAKIFTHNTGNIDSIGNVIFLSGDERFACKHSTFMFHGVGLDVANHRLEEKNLRETLASIRADQKRIADIMVDRAGIHIDKASKLFAETRTIDADVALADGFITAVKDVQIPAGSTVVSLVFNA